MYKIEIRTLTLTTYKNQLKLDERLKCKMQNYRSSGKQHETNIHDLVWPEIVLDKTLKATRAKNI